MRKLSAIISSCWNSRFQPYGLSASLLFLLLSVPLSLFYSVFVWLRLFCLVSLSVGFSIFLSESCCLCTRSCQLLSVYWKLSESCCLCTRSCQLLSVYWKLSDSSCLCTGSCLTALVCVLEADSCSLCTES